MMNSQYPTGSGSGIDGSGKTLRRSTDCDRLLDRRCEDAKFVRGQTLKRVETMAHRTRAAAAGSTGKRHLLSKTEADMKLCKHAGWLVLSMLLLAVPAQAQVTSSAYDQTVTDGDLHVVCYAFLLENRVMLNATCNSSVGLGGGPIAEGDMVIRGAVIDLSPEVAEVCRDGLSLEATASAINLVTSGVSNCNYNDTDRADLGEYIEWDGKHNFGWRPGYGPGT